MKPETTSVGAAAVPVAIVLAVLVSVRTLRSAPAISPNASGQQAVPGGVPTTPHFEAASIRPCVMGVGTGRGGSTPPIATPGRWNAPCTSVAALIRWAYLGNPEKPAHDPIVGSPDWIASERYEISAVADGNPTRAMMTGPMLQVLLEDRFSLRIHRETKDAALYALTVAPSGFKLPPFDTVSDCVNYGPNNWPPIPRKPPCGRGGAPIRGIPDDEGNVALYTFSTRKGTGVDRTYDALPVTMTHLSMYLSGLLDRPVIDKTGIAGRFDVHLEFSPDGTSLPPDPAAAAASPSTAPPIFTAVREQLGLMLDPARGPWEVFVIDRIERPSPN
jgi:uncharacterized protein (TIGR03435 family)